MNSLPVPLTALRVTAGRVTETPAGRLAVRGPTERAVLRVGRHREALLRFRYRGPSRPERTRPGASETVFRQIGLKLRTADSCNVLYAMWRIEPTEQLLVTLKRNPGQHRHADCGANGYHDLARVPLSAFGLTATDGKPHQLRARLTPDGTVFRLRVGLDGRNLWAGDITTDRLDFDGPAGFRTDNGRFRFRLFVVEAG